jgi:hypothetical protein
LEPSGRVHHTSAGIVSTITRNLSSDFRIASTVFVDSGET